MPQRGIDTGIWSHIDFCELSPQEKLLFLYLVTSFRSNQAGLYRVTERQIAFDTGLDEAQLPDMMRRLEVMDVEWYQETQTVWVKRFLHHQCHAPKFLIAVAKNLEDMRRHHELVRAYLEFNNSLSIPYQEPIDNVSISGQRQISNSTESVSETETDIDGAPRLIFDHWNSKDIIKHKKLTSAIRSAIRTRLKDYSLEEIKTSIDTYAEILKGPEYYWSHPWTLLDYLKPRNIEKFMEPIMAREAFKAHEGNGRRSERVADTYKSPAEILNS